jgi:hypothetical protein
MLIQPWSDEYICMEERKTTKKEKKKEKEKYPILPPS